MRSARDIVARRREDIREASDFRTAVMAGLSATPKRIPCKFFYDAEGSKLFEKICALPEYYPTRTEITLLRHHAAEIAELIGPDSEIVEFGAGAGEKIRTLLTALERPRAYLPIDISGPYLRSVAARLEADYPRLAVHPIVADFAGRFDLPERRQSMRRIGFFPGSTIGNFEPDDARRFLSRAAALLHGGGLLIGADLVKDPVVLNAAYNDLRGVTAAFNKNLLVRANRELSANFELSRFRHYAGYDPVAQRMGIYLISTDAQRVTVAGQSFALEEGEAIHTEWSHKYTIDGFRTLASDAGFRPRAVWCDDKRLFSIHWLETA
jgi:dimethylhistidine N-methyltransferase